MLETARDALFLAKLPPSTLPWMYLTIAGLGLLLTRLLPARKKSTTASIAMLVAAAVAALFWWSLGDGSSKAGLYALFIWTGTFGAVVNVELWLLLGGAFDVGQAKRLFGLIGAGAVLGATLGALVARLVAGALGARQLLLAAGISFLVAWLPTLLLERKVHRVSASQDEARGPDPALKKRSFVDDLRATSSDPYLLRIGVFLFLGTVTLAVGDYIFKAKMAEDIPKAGLATAFATAYLGFNALSLLVQVGLTSAILRWLGVKRALFVLPVLVVAGAVGIGVLPTLAAAIALRSTDGALRHSLHKTTTELLLLPLPDADRRRAKPVIDLLAQRGGQALSALGVLLLVQLFSSLRVLAGLAVATGLGWIFFAAQVGAPYVDAFRKRLRKGAIDFDEGIPELDLGALEALFAALNSPKDAEVMGALDLLAAQQRARLIPALILYHPSKDVVLRALALMVEAQRDDFLPITERLLEHNDPEVRAAALRARASVGGPALKEVLSKLVDDPRPEIRATALVALSAAGHIEQRAAMASLHEMLEADDPYVVLPVLRAMGAQPMPAFRTELVALAKRRQAHSVVRGEAALALGRLAAVFPSEANEAIAAVHVLMPLREEGPYARAAFESIGEPALLYADAYLKQHRGPLAWCAVRSLAAFDAQRSAPMLLHHLQHSLDGLVRFRCIRYLKRIRSEQPEIELDLAALTSVARSTMKHVLDLLELRTLVVAAQTAEAEGGGARTAAAQLLIALLDDKRSNAMGRVFMLLGLLHPDEDFDRVSRGLASSDNRIRASSRELCHNVVAPELRELLGLLIDDLDDVTRLERALGKERRSFASYSELVSELATRSGELGALARYHALELGVSVELRSNGPESSAFAQRVAAGAAARRGAVSEARHE